jgi:hypothetical protein
LPLPEKLAPPGTPAAAVIVLVLAQAVARLPDQVRHLEMENEARSIEWRRLARHVPANAPRGGMALTWCLTYRPPRRHALPVGRIVARDALTQIVTEFFDKTLSGCRGSENRLAVSSRSQSAQY